MVLVNHVSIGVYKNFDFVVNVVRPEHLHSHVHYNVENRPGRALFIDGVCVVPAGLDKESINSWEERISIMNIDSSEPSDYYK